MTTVVNSLSSLKVTTMPITSAMASTSAQHDRQPHPSAHSSTTSHEHMPPPCRSIVKKKPMRTSYQVCRTGYL